MAFYVSYQSYSFLAAIILKNDGCVTCKRVNKHVKTVEILTFAVVFTI